VALSQHRFVFNCKQPLDYYFKAAEDFVCSLGQPAEVGSIKKNMMVGIKEILLDDALLQKLFNPLIAKLEKEIAAGNEVGSHFLASFSGTLAANLHDFSVEKRNEIADKLRTLIAQNLAEIAPAAIEANPSLLSPWLAFCEAHYDQKDYEKMVAPLFLNCCERGSVY
jgi:hypothetical protein